MNKVFIVNYTKGNELAKSVVVAESDNHALWLFNQATQNNYLIDSITEVDTTQVRVLC